MSDCPAFAVLSALIRVSAAAASSNAQLTDDVNLRRTSGSAKALPSAVDNLPIPILFSHQYGYTQKEKTKQNSSYLTLYMLLNNLSPNRMLDLCIVCPESFGKSLFSNSFQVVYKCFTL